jgi:succinoglycan biosynthesis protein ExoA
MAERPLISIIIPCFQEDRNIEACLRSILAQEPVPGGFELLVVDGRSTDGTREIIQRICREDERVRLLDNPQRFPSFAMNRGILAAQGSIIIRMDAHVLYAPDYIKQCVRILEETQATMSEVHTGPPETHIFKEPWPQCTIAPMG